MWGGGRPLRHAHGVQREEPAGRGDCRGRGRRKEEPEDRRAGGGGAWRREEPTEGGAGGGRSWKKEEPENGRGGGGRSRRREERAEGGARGGRSPGSPGGGRRTDHFGAAVDSTGSQAQPTGPELQRPRGNGPPRDLARRSRGRGQGRAEPPCSRSHERGRHLQRAAPHPVPQARRPALPQPGRLWHSLVGTTRRLARAGGSEAPTHPHAAARQVGCRRGAPRSRGLGRPQPGRTMVMRRLRRSESLSPWANLVQGRNYPGRASDFATRPASPPTRGVPTL